MLNTPHVSLWTGASLMVYKPPHTDLCCVETQLCGNPAMWLQAKSHGFLKLVVLKCCPSSLSMCSTLCKITRLKQYFVQVRSKLHLMKACLPEQLLNAFGLRYQSLMCFVVFFFFLRMRFSVWDYELICKDRNIVTRLLNQINWDWTLKL